VRDPNTESLLASQRKFYDERAEDYMDESKPSDRRIRGGMDRGLARALVAEFHPVGRALELACGKGIFTGEIARYADSVTAVDASPRMLAIAAQSVEDPKVTFVVSDIFDWEPDGQYDAVFFGHWLSHVPPDLFDEFWALVRRCLTRNGRVGFVDEDDRAADFDDVREVSGVPAALRRLSDGREFDIVKVFWRPDDLEHRLRSSGWDISVRRVGESSLYGAGSAAG
jgi:ubiquinone/menaquinone biosynthesis C-methylase UbiE